MKITLELIHTSLRTQEELILTKVEIQRVKQLCKFFNIEEPKMKRALYQVRMPELRSTNGIQRLVFKNNKFFFVGETNTLISGHVDLFELDQIPFRLRQFAEVRMYVNG